MFDAGLADGTPWIAMKRIHGLNLQEYVEKIGPLAPTIAFEIGAQVAEALRQARDKDIVHRDVKPSNILLERGPRPLVYLGDFGIGKILEDNLQTQTKPVDVRLTPPYAAPEQFSGGAVSWATDVYGLGRTLYTLITGRIPLPQRPLVFDDLDLSPEIQNVLCHATAEEPSERPTPERLMARLRSLAAATPEAEPFKPTPQAADGDRELRTDAPRTLPAITKDEPEPRATSASGVVAGGASATPGDRGGGGSTASRRRPGKRAAAIIVAVGILAGLLAFYLITREPSQSDTARVLVVVDLSLKMFCPQALTTGERCTRALIEKEATFPTANQRPTRIGQAQSFAMDGIAALNRANDELGISTFYSTRGRAVLETKLPTGKVRDVAASPSAARGKLRQALAAIEGTTGGSPLRAAMDAAVDALRSGSPTDGSATNTVVVLTDGNDNGSKITAEALTQKLAAADSTRPVRILATAADETSCGQLRSIVEATDGDCFAAPNEKALICASDNILANLRRPHPKEPRSHAQIVEDREDC